MPDRPTAKDPHIPDGGVPAAGIVLRVDARTDPRLHLEAGGIGREQLRTRAVLPLANREQRWHDRRARVDHS